MSRFATFLKHKKPSFKFSFPLKTTKHFHGKRKMLFKSLSAVVLLLILVVGGGSVQYQIVQGSGSNGTTSPESSGSSASKTSREPVTYSSSVEVITQESSLSELGLESSSYAGEVVSKMDSNVYPAREGIIISLTVNIGTLVRQGQVIGQLSVSPQFDQIATTAEKKGELENTRGKLDAINAQLSDVQNRLNNRKSSADAAKNAKVNNANNEFNTGAITVQEKEERIKEAESEYAEVVTSADNEISSLSREKREAEKEVQSAESVSTAVIKGVDKNIYATRGGIISGIFKNVGDSVGPQDKIAAIGIKTPTKKDRCVRFRIPGTQTLPKVDDIVTISRPGMPLAKEKAKITGVGTALDDNGHYVVEAFFEKIVDWPVHSSARVQLDNQFTTQIFIPLSAVWFDNEGITSVWIADNQNKITAYNVKTGRAVSDRIEILEGLRKDDKVVLRPQSSFRNGDFIKETEVNTQRNAPPAAESAGDGHAHEH